MASMYNEKAAEYILQQPIYYNDSERDIEKEIQTIEKFNPEFKPIYEKIILQQNHQKQTKINRTIL
tara:strand:- start:29 stop:226 length:198 start_codon:yes stop_codon:yes gene_type:complete